MTFVRGHRGGALQLAILTFVFAIYASASSATPSGLNAHATKEQPSDCVQALLPPRPLTLQYLREANTKTLTTYIAKHPLRGFVRIEEEIKKEQSGVQGPRALQDLIGPGRSFVSSPAPTAPNDTTINLMVEGRSIPLHTDIMWHGHRTSTAVYFSLPKTIAKANPTTGHMLQPEDYPVVYVHLHGGGTPTATGKNAMSIGEALAKKNLPVFAMDLPCHGRATCQLAGLMSIQDQVDWVLAILKQYIDPRVKIIMGGHSWGGQFAIFMQRHSRDPRYSQIVHFEALSPPVDVSLGKNDASKYEFDEKWEKDFRLFEHLIAPSDFEFQLNSLSAGKTSNVGAYPTAGSNMGYLTPPLTLEEQAGLTPIDIIVGESDGPVYVQREDKFEAAFGNLAPPSTFQILRKGKTFRSKSPTDLKMTGHNIFDLLVQLPDGTWVPYVYWFLTQKVLSYAGPDGIPADTASPEQKTVDEVLRAWAGFPLFREYVKGLDQFVETQTDEAKNLGERRRDVDKYMREVDNVRKLGVKTVDDAIEKARAQLRAKLGINDLNSLDRVNEELSYPEVLTPEREQALKDFVAACYAMEADLKANFKDPQNEADLAALEADFAPLMNKLGLSESYSASKNGENDKDKDGAFSRALKAKLDEFQARRKDKLPPDQIEDRANLSKLNQRYLEFKQKHSGRYGLERDRLIGLIKRPDGVNDIRRATRELKAVRTPERRAALLAYLQQYPAVDEVARLAAQAEVEAKVAAVKLPAGIESAEAVSMVHAEITDRMDMTYAPPGLKDVEAVAARLRRAKSDLANIQVNRNGMGGSLANFAAEVKAMQLKLRGQLRLWESLWTGEEKTTGDEDLAETIEPSDKAKKSTLTSPALEAKIKDVDQLLEIYAEINAAFTTKLNDWLLELERADKLDNAHIFNPPAEIISLRESSEAAKVKFVTARAGLAALRVQEALNGSLQSDSPEAAAQAQELARTIFGTSYEKPGGLVETTRTLERQLETLRREESLKKQTFERLQWEYSNAMLAHGQKIPYVITRVNLDTELNRGYEELVARLTQVPEVHRAFKETLKQWADFQGTLREESQTRETGTN